MADGTWFRSDDWSKSAQDLFYEKIGRSKSNFHRQQYARIKANALIKTRSAKNTRSAIDILRQSLGQWCSEPSEAVQARATLGLAYRQLGDYTNAVHEYERSIARDNPVIHRGYWEYPEMIVTNRITERYDRALEIVEATVRRYGAPIFPNDKFILYAVRAITKNHLYPSEDIRQETANALAAASHQQSGLRSHQDIGSVDKKQYGKLISQLNTLADSQS